MTGTAEDQPPTRIRRDRWNRPVPGGTRWDRCGRPPYGRFAGTGGRLLSMWRVKDSNLGSFRDGFTVRSHWPLGQPASWVPPHRGATAQVRIAVHDPGGANGYRRHAEAFEYGRSDVADPSFDIVSKVDRQELDNAVNQAAKELP